MDFFTEFMNAALADQKTVDGFSSIDDDDKWTTMVLDFLERWGKRTGYEVRREKPTRLDMVWLKDEKEEVAIEHENDGTDYCPNEIGNLLSLYEATDRVLITYFRDRQFGDSLREIRILINQKLISKRPSFNFWLIVAPSRIQSPAEFTCVRFSPKFVEEIVPPARFPRNERKYPK